MTRSPIIAVSSVSFSKNATLRSELSAQFPNSRFNESGRNLSTDELIAFFSHADGILVGTEPINREVINGSPSVSCLAKYGVGLDNVDIDYCRQANVAIGWTGGVNKYAVAELVIGYMITLSRNMFMSANQLKAGGWHKFGGRQLSGLTIGIIGLGHIGQELVRLLQPFEPTILANDIADRSEFATTHGVQLVGLSTLVSRSDIITIHTPLTALTHHLINAGTLSLMKPTAIVINTARGPVIDQAALTESLANGVIGAAALDVYAVEPETDARLLALPNLFCTPHIGGNSIEAVLAMGREAIHHLVQFFTAPNLMA